MTLQRGMLLFLVLLAAAGSVSAEELRGIYVVDVQRIIDSSIIGKAAKNNMETEIKKSEAKLVQSRQELEKMRADITKQSSLLSKDAREEKQELLQKKEKDFQRAVQDRREELSRKNDAEMMKVLAEVQKTVRELAEQGKYQVIMERDPRLVLYTSEAYDLTDQVVKALDTKKVEF